MEALMFEFECLTQNNSDVIYRADCSPIGGSGCWPDMTGQCGPDCNPSDPPMCTPDDSDCYPGDC